MSSSGSPAHFVQMSYQGIIETDVKNRVCKFKVTKPDVDYQAKLAEFAKTNTLLVGYEIQ